MPETINPVLLSAIRELDAEDSSKLLAALAARALLFDDQHSGDLFIARVVEFSQLTQLRWAAAQNLKPTLSPAEARMTANLVILANAISSKFPAQNDEAPTTSPTQEEPSDVTR